MSRTETQTTVPGLGWRGGLRYLWTQLTSMRTALILLFALAVAAIPGSLLPQRSVAPVRVSDYIKANPRLGPLYDRIGLFEVYTSPWFSAVYLLLFVSLVGCIIPRIGVYARALRAQPPKMPRNLARLPAYASAGMPESDGVLPRAAELLRQRRYRVVTRDDGLAAERGYLREAGNLIFHVSVLVFLLGVAMGMFFGYRGTSLVIVGQGFANNLTQYDDFSSGARFTESDLVPFGLTVERFDAKFETGPVQRGAARLFRAEVEVVDRPGATPRREVLEVNRPLQIGGSSVHLIGHGYAPLVTVKDGDGNVAFSGPVPFLPQDGNFTSAGVIKAPDGRPERLGFQAFFLPTAIVDDKGPRSIFPDAVNPALFTNVWYGPPKTETGRPENVYSLNTTGMTALRDKANGDLVRLALQVGDGKTLPDGKGSIQLDGWVRWVKLQVSDTPGLTLSLVALAFAVTGLCLSLFIRPRRVWVRVRAGQDGHSVVEVGGLDRADARAGLSEDVAELAAELAGDKDKVGAA
jgi:cytochrome c biogenesis protein